MVYLVCALKVGTIEWFEFLLVWMKKLVEYKGVERSPDGKRIVRLQRRWFKSGGMLKVNIKLIACKLNSGRFILVPKVSLNALLDIMRFVV